MPLLDPNEKITIRSVFLTVLVPIFIPTLTLVAAIWYAAIWTSGQENKTGRIEDRVTVVEKKTDGATAHETRINQLEFRLNWMDEEKNRDRNERKQIDRDIRESLEKLNNAVARLDAWNPANRRR